MLAPPSYAPYHAAISFAFVISRLSLLPLIFITPPVSFSSSMLAAIDIDTTLILIIRQSATPLPPPPDFRYDAATPLLARLFSRALF
jgi:hypothetical protein